MSKIEKNAKKQKFKAQSIPKPGKTSPKFSLPTGRKKKTIHPPKETYQQKTRKIDQKSTKKSPQKRNIKRNSSLNLMPKIEKKTEKKFKKTRKNTKFTKPCLNRLIETDHFSNKVVIRTSKKNRKKRKKSSKIDENRPKSTKKKVQKMRKNHWIWTNKNRLP